MKCTEGKLKVSEYNKQFVDDSEGQAVFVAHAGATGSTYANAAELAHRWNVYPELVKALENAQCGCSPQLRDSGHISGCWMVAAEEALELAKKGPQ